MPVGSLQALIMGVLLVQSPEIPLPLRGSIADEAGRPVPGADVWLVDKAGSGDGVPVARTTSNENGSFSILQTAGTWGRGSTLWVARAGHGAAHVPYPSNWPEAASRVVLAPSSGSRVRVEGPDRRPIAGATVRVTRLHRDWVEVPDAMARKFEGTTNAEGLAVLEAFATEEILAVEVQADGFGTQPRTFIPAGSGLKVVRLRPSGRVVGRVVADDPSSIGGWVVSASTLSDDDPTHPASWVGRAEALTDREGRFALPPLALGKLSLAFRPPEGSRYRPIPVPDRTLEGGAGLEVEVTLARAVRVEGLVREGRGGPPIVGARVTVSTPSTPSRGHPVWTDARGRYTFDSLPGRVSATVTGLPQGYVDGLGLALREVKIPKGVDRFELPTIEAVRGEAIRGVVLDERGLPVPGASVLGHWGMVDDQGGRLSAALGGTTGLDGTFVFEGIQPGAEVTGLSARHRDRATATLATARAGQRESVTLRVATGITASLGGRVLDRDGRPVAGALVSISDRTRHDGTTSTYGGPVRFDDNLEVRTGLDGTFRTPRELSRESEYRAEVGPSGFLPARSAFVRPVPGDSTRVPDLVIRREPRERWIAGRVLDRQARPVVGVQVSSNGDGTSQVRATSDVDGTFRVTGASGSPSLIFARASSFRGTGQVVPLDTTRVELVLARAGDPLAEAKTNATSGLTRDEEKALASRLLKPLFPAILNASPSALKPEALAALARSDADRVVGLLQDQVIEVDQSLALEMALGHLERSPTEAFESIQALENPTIAFRTALDIFDARPDQSPAWRRSLLDLALARAREGDDPSQTIVNLAQVADRLLALGAIQPGKDLVREAEVLAKPLPRDGFIYPRDSLANALARLDLTSALNLIGPVRTGNYNDRAIYSMSFRAVALRVAASQPAEAERLQSLVIPDDARAKRTLIMLCARMAKADLLRARRLAMAADDPDLRVMALGAMAGSLAKSDPIKARGLLDEAFAQSETPRKDGVNPAEEMAWLLLVAERIDPRIVPEYLWRCLSGQSPVSTAPSAEQVRSSLVVAALVGQYNREAAAVVFAPMFDHLPGLVATSEDRSAYPVADAVAAASAFDPRAVASILERLPEKPNGGGDHRPIDAARVAAARMIALTWSERISQLATRSPVIDLDDLAE